MEALIGILFKKRCKSNISLFEDLVTELSKRDSVKSEIWHNDFIGFGYLGMTSLKESYNKNILFFHEETQCCITSVSRIDYRKELMTKLDEDWQELHESSDSQLILRSYLKWGKDCVDYLYGDFSFAIWDNRNEELFCARDHFGCRPFYYVDQKEFVFFSSDIKAFAELSLLTIRIDDQGILDSICAIPPEKSRTVFKNVFRLEPASYLNYKQNGKIRSSKYWNLKIVEEYSRLNEEQAIIGLKELFTDAVFQRCQSDFPIGIELSGGLDSSSIAVTVDKILKEDRNLIFAFSHVLNKNVESWIDVKNNDLSCSLQIIALSNNIKHSLIACENGYDGSFNSIVAALELNLSPVVQNYAMLSDLLYQKANALGVRVLLSGFGGDEGVTSQASSYFKDLASNRRIRELHNELKKNDKKGWRFYKQCSVYCLLAISPRLYKIVSELNPFKKDWRQNKFNEFAIDRELKKTFRQRRRYLQKVFINHVPDVRRKQLLRMENPSLVERLESSYSISQKNNIDYRYPFLDVKLAEFFYSLNSAFKYKNGIGRYIFRQSMDKILPERIRTRNDKSGRTIPNVLQRLLIDEKKFIEIIEEGRSKNNFHYVDYDKLSQLIDRFKDDNFKNHRIGTRAFFNPISVLILQKWQREGKIDIGIKC